MKQIELLDHPTKKFAKGYGGSFSTTRLGRTGPRPLSASKSIHLVLRSTKAKGAWSFLKSKNEQLVREIILRFGKKYGVKVISVGNAGNHLHMQIKLTNRHTYAAFIRAVTGAIAIKITGKTRWWRQGTDKEVSQTAASIGKKLKFWDYRPFTRIVTSLREILNLKDYIQVNALEGYGHTRAQARFLIEWDRGRRMPS